MQPRHVLPLGIVLLVAGTLAHASWGHIHEDLSGHAFGSDDAFISYRYARALAGGQGLVPNPGERVEGYSNLLYVLLLAPAVPLVRGIGILHHAIGLNLLCAIGALVVLHRRLSALPGPAALAALLLATAPITWLWIASGMETAFVLLLQVLLWREATATGETERAGPLAAWIALLVLARADGFVGAGLVVAWLLLAGRRGAARRAAAALFVTMGALTAWRLLYYGAPLPNTFHAKVAGPAAERVQAAVQQLLDLSWLAGLLPHLAVVALALAAAARRRQLPPFEAFFAAGWLAYWIAVGGDVYGERFLLVLVPLAAALAARALAARPATALLGLGAIALLQLLPFATDRRFRYHPGDPRYDRWVTLGRLLSGTSHRGQVLATDAAGKMPYVSGLRAIDMLGLTDAHIARRPATAFRNVGHNKHDAAYVLGRRPDLIATWIDADLDLRWDLPRARYEPAGYRLRYLAYTRRRPPGEEPAIIDVRQEGLAAAAERIRRGWSYAVLERPGR